MTAAEPVRSPQNARLKLVRKLSSRRGREREAAFAVDGEDLVFAGLQAGWSCRFVLVDEARGAAQAADLEAAGVEVVPVEGALIAELASLAWGPRVIGVFNLPGAAAVAGALRDHLAQPRAGPAVYLDGMNDPGNVGTVLRSAAAFGAAGVVLGPGTADAFSPRALRAAMGATFSVAHAPGRVDDLAGRPLVALSGDAERSIWDHELDPRSVLCIGDERAGVSDEVRNLADVLLRIPQGSKVESLNAAQAATLALYEWRRQHASQGNEEPPA